MNKKTTVSFLHLSFAIGALTHGGLNANSSTAGAIADTASPCAAEDEELMK